MTDDFSKHPQTIGEIRASKAGTPVDWTPRDILIATLREIDSGKIAPTHCVVVFGYIDKDGNSETEFKSAGAKNPWEALGLLTEAINGIVR